MAKNLIGDWQIDPCVSRSLLSSKGTSNFPGFFWENPCTHSSYRYDVQCHGVALYRTRSRYPRLRRNCCRVVVYRVLGQSRGITGAQIPQICGSVESKDGEISSTWLCSEDCRSCATIEAACGPVQRAMEQRNTSISVPASLPRKRAKVSIYQREGREIVIWIRGVRLK